MSLEDNFSLALADIKNHLPPKSLHYLTSILQKGWDNVDKGNIDNYSDGGTVTGGDPNHSSNWSESSGSRGIGTLLSADFSDKQSGDGDDDEAAEIGRPRSEEDLECEKAKERVNNKHTTSVTLPFLPSLLADQDTVGERRATGGGGGRRYLHHLSASPYLHQASLGITLRQKNEPLCSHLFPICRKILAKTPPIQRPGTKIGVVEEDLGVKSVSEVVEREEKNQIRSSERDSPYQELIGKISETRVQKDFARVPAAVLLATIAAKEPKATNRNRHRKNKKDQEQAGVCDFSRPISNPLYKVYNPKGYQKTDDEVVLEHIEKIGREFNEWLSTLEGDAVQLDLPLLTRILRHELQFPDRE